MYKEETMKSKISILFLVMLVLVILFTACQSAATPAPTQAPAQAPKSQDSIAILLTGPHEDNSWNEAGYNAVKALEAKGVKVAYSESIKEGDEQRVLREYVDQGYKVIVGHSFGFGDGVFAVAEESPNANFAWAGGIKRTGKNVADYDQPFYQAAYPVGVIAGYMSKTGKLGGVYGFDIPVCHAMGEALLAGAKSVNPDAELLVSAVGDWVDVAKAKAAALALADAGVDFFIECGEGPALGTIKAAEERNLYATGYVGDMSENGPKVVLTSIIWNMEPLLQKMIDDTNAGSFDNPWYVYGVKEGAMLYSINPGLKDKIPPEAIAAAEKAMADIKAGKLEVPFVPEASQ
jgi:simple sugar transport system substrate-binding protein/basic membrane protein A